MWDLQSGKLLRQIADAHPMGSAVLHVMVRKKNFLNNFESILFFLKCGVLFSQKNYF